MRHLPTAFALHRCRRGGLPRHSVERQPSDNLTMPLRRRRWSQRYPSTLLILATGGSVVVAGPRTARELEREIHGLFFFETFR